MWMRGYFPYVDAWIFVIVNYRFSIKFNKKPSQNMRAGRLSKKGVG